MNKQKLFFNLSVVLIVAASINNATVLRANAGEVNAQGTTSESTGYSGDNFLPFNQRTILEPAEGIDSIEINDGSISVSPNVQSRVNQVAGNILNEVAICAAGFSICQAINDDENITIANDDGDKTNSTFNRDGDENLNIEEISPELAAIAIITGEANTDGVISRLQNVLIEAGVNSTLIERLINSMQGMISSPSAALSGVPVANSKDNDKTANKSYLLAQNNRFNVNINKLNSAITAYNKIVMDSDVKTLRELANNQDFLAIRNILNQLRTALNRD